MNNICFFDIETNSKEAMLAEIITGFFHCTEFEDFFYESQVDNWSKEAENVHDIKENDMIFFEKKEIALKKLNVYLNSLPESTLFVCYANANNMGEYYHFDRAVIDMQMNIYGYKVDLSNIKSAHTMAKSAYKSNLFMPNKKLSKKNRLINDFTQSGVFNALFGYSFDGAHDAKNDVLACKKIYYELDDILSKNRKAGDIRQMELIWIKK